MLLRRRPPPTGASRCATRRSVGPLDVYYYDYFADIPGADLSKTALAAREDGDVLAYEALNLADGKRSVSEIRDVLAGRYAPVAPARGRRVLRAASRRPAPSASGEDRADRVDCFSVPPRSHGGTEIAIDRLTRGLVARGHDVTLFASGDSRTTGALCTPSSRARPRTIPTSTSYLEREYEVRNVAEAYALADRFDVLHSHWPTPAAYFSDRRPRRAS